MKGYPLHPDDLQELNDLRGKLRVLRRQNGLTHRAAAAAVGRGHDFVVGLEKAKTDSPALASLQDWAHAVGARVEFELDGFWDVPHTDGRMLSLFKAGQPWGAHEPARMWVVAALRAWRVKNGWDVEHVAPLMGLQAESIVDGESKLPNPMFGRACFYARVLQTLLRLRLFTRDEWLQR